VVVSGCAWRLLPHDLVPWEAAYRWFRTWSADGTRDRVLDARSVKTHEGGRRSATTPASGSAAASGTCWSTPSAWCRRSR
jgi:transposase